MFLQVLVKKLLHKLLNKLNLNIFIIVFYADNKLSRLVNFNVILFFTQRILF
jgi:hypothetical protein